MRLTSTIKINTGDFFHTEVSRNGNIIRLFVDGFLEDTVIDSTPFEITSTADKVMIGANADSASSTSWDGNIEELEVTKGVGRNTEAFTPPTVPLPRR